MWNNPTQRVKTGAGVIALVAVVGGSSGCVEDPAGQEGIDAYSFLVGSWEGELEYLDYGDNRSLVQLPTSMRCEPGADGTSLELTFSYVEPSGRVERSTDRLIPTSEGVYFGDLWRIKEPVQRMSDGVVRVVLERDGEDNGQPATIENSIVLDGDELTITSAVIYSASGEMLQRNQYRLRRSDDGPEGE
jgi:hypothetical protein